MRSPASLPALVRVRVRVRACPRAAPLLRAFGCPRAALQSASSSADQSQSAVAPPDTPHLPPSLARSRRVYQPESLDLLYRHYYKDFRYG